MGELDGVGPDDRLERLGGLDDSLEHVGHDRLRRIAHVLERLRRLDAEPAVLVGEQAYQDRQRRGVFNVAERLARALACVRVGAFRQFDQCGHQGLCLRPGGQSGGRPTAHHRRPIAERRHQFSCAFGFAIHIEAPGGDRCRHVGAAQPVRRVGLAPRDEQLFQRQRIGQHVAGVRAQTVVAALAVIGVVVGLAGAVLLAAVVGEGAVAPPHEVEMPRGFLHERRRRRRSAHVGAQRAPEVAEALPGVAVLTVLIGRRHHLREEPGRLDLVGLEREQHGRHGVFAVVLVVRPRQVFAVGDRALVHVVAEEFVSPVDGGLHFRVRDAALFPHDDRQVADQPRGIHRAVRRDRAVQFPLGRQFGDAVSERAVQALPFGQVDCVFVDRVQHGLVAGEEIVFTEEQIDVTPMPDDHAAFQFQLQRRRCELARELLYARQVFRFSRRHQRKAVDRAPQVRFQRLALQRLAGLGKDQLRFLAVIGRGRAVAAHDAQLELDLFRFPLAPARELQHA